MILESESTSRSVGHPLLAVNVTGVIQVFDFTGNVCINPPHVIVLEYL